MKYSDLIGRNINISESGHVQYSLILQFRMENIKVDTS